MEPATPLPADADEALVNLYELWQSKCHGARLPGAADVGLEDLFQKDPRHGLIAIKDDDGRQRFHFVRESSLHRFHAGRPVENIPLDEIVMPQVWPDVERAYRQIMRERRPHYWLRTGAYIGGMVFTYERLLVPLAEDGETVDSFLGLWIGMDAGRWNRGGATPPQLV